MEQRKITDTIAIIRGGGDLATGVAQKLFHAGFKVVMLETAHPLMIRRQVSLGSAVTDGQAVVEDLTGVCTTAARLEKVWQQQQIPIVVDAKGELIHKLQPTIVIDGILAKRNLGTHRNMAPVTIALGPGFKAPEDVDAVIETMRGHQLGMVIQNGAPLPNTGIPGVIAGKSDERVIHAPAAGLVKFKHDIGDIVQKGEVLFYIGVTPVHSPLSGTLRGLIAEGTWVNEGLKIADVDPRTDVACDHISDKARAIGGGALDAVFMIGRHKGLL